MTAVARALGSDPDAPEGLADAAAPRTDRRQWILLGIAPVGLALLAGALWWFVASADKDLQETSALQWATKLYPQLREHLSLTLWSTLWVLLIAVPAGILLTRPRLARLGSPLLAIASSGQAIPAYGLFVILFTWLGRGPRTAIAALVLFTVLPVLRNTMVGLEQVDRSVIEAGRGMGMTKVQALRSIELPLAVPVILAGVRTALVINVGMASLAFIIGGGGLGITINSGIKLSRDLVLFTGAAATALLALAVDWVAAVVERVLRPRGL